MQKSQLDKTETPPYQIVSQVNFRLAETATYQKLLQRFDPQLLTLISPLDSNLMNQVIYLINCDMQPDNKQWLIWKNSDEIKSFLENFDNEMDEMMSMRERQSPNSSQLNQTYHHLKTMQASGPQFVNTFIQWMNLVGAQTYLRKTEDYMIFIDHCVPIDKWHMQIYQQMQINKAPTLKNKIFGLFSQEAKKEKTRDYFITITSEGILKSYDHLMVDKIHHMIPFTNQTEVKRNVNGDFVSYSIHSCQHEATDIYFYDDYVKAINFGCALGKSLEDSGYNKPRRFKSYSQMRENCDSKLYNDGFQYYDDLYEEISRAQFQICMTGWMITPYFRLRRPGPISEKTYRLDGALHAAAKRGVRVFVICFMEPKGFVNNDSEHVEEAFEAMHKNIQVVRHPNGAIPLLWSHHEKMVVIDQRLGFMGGLDICYGRWDTPDHFMFDPSQIWDGCEYNNYRTHDVYEPRKYKDSNLNSAYQPRMPWHDIAIQLRGDSVIDMLRHFVQYWYFVKEELEFDSVKFFENTKKRFTEALNHEDVQVKAEMSQYIGNVEKQAAEKENKKKESTITKLKNKMKVMVSGEEIIVNELFIDKRPGQIAGSQRQQMCRSASTWSIGVKKGNHEQSIHNAYVQLITESEQFIYIENQFFMGLENKIVETLAKRICRAFDERKPFKVVIVMPLLPGFEGDITDPASTVLRIQVHHQYQAIKRGKDALFKRLAHIPNIDDYIFFFGLRQSCILEGVPITEIIYVHSKLMIVDDKRFIIGSANINDRSLLGCRDSEIAIIIDESQGGDKSLNLRARLFQEHFDLSEQENRNIMDPHVWNKVIQNAKSNTMIYREIFGCLPDDTAFTSADCPELEKRGNLNRYADLRNRIVGHACVFPMDFMKDQDLTFRPNQKEFFAPVSSFT